MVSRCNPVVSAAIGGLPIQPRVSLRNFTTLRAGGAAELFATARDANQLASAAQEAQSADLRTTVLGFGSNMLPSDDGVPGLVLHNLASRISVAKTGEVLADTGCSFQELFLKTAQAGLHGLEFAVGIPGTLGGALVSNAGAYRSCVSEYLTRLEIVFQGKRDWVKPEWMQFSYRDSVLRQSNPPPCVVVRVEMRLPKGDPAKIYEDAREYQRQRISKQPPPASAGSFFKNVLSAELAGKLETLPPKLKESGVVPAGYLIEAAGLKGFRMGGAMFGVRHANFILNVGSASAFEIRRLAHFGKKVVRERFAVELEEEVLYLGDWSRFRE
jgi:UDP-N-acetylmuramate dehydrogenase